jgi:hypothetical protein
MTSTPRAPQSLRFTATFSGLPSHLEKKCGARGALLVSMGMSTTTPTPQNPPQAPFELPPAEFDEPPRAGAESACTAGVSLPHVRRPRPWASVALALPVALALLALLAAAHFSRPHHSSGSPVNARISKRPRPHGNRAIKHGARDARRPTHHPPHTRRTSAVPPVAQLTRPVAPVARATEPTLDVSPAASATEPAQLPAARPSSSGGEEQSGGGPFSP